MTPQEFDDMDEYKHLPGNMKSTLIELNIADDYFKAKARSVATRPFGVRFMKPFFTRYGS